MPPPPQPPANFALYTRFPTLVFGLFDHVDIWPTEEHVLTLVQTEHPVESGRILTDNAVRMPIYLRLTGWVSDLLLAPGYEFSGHPSLRGPNTWQVIMRLMEEREPTTVYTALHHYENMLITNATAGVSVQTGTSLQFEMTLTEILVGETEVQPIKPAKVRIDRSREQQGLFGGPGFPVGFAGAQPGAASGIPAPPPPPTEPSLSQTGLFGGPGGYGPGGYLSPGAYRTSTVSGGTRAAQAVPQTPEHLREVLFETHTGA